MDLIKDLLRRPTFWYLVLILLAMGWVREFSMTTRITWPSVTAWTA